MLRQLLTGFFDAVDNAICEVTSSYLVAHRCDNTIPKFLTHFFVNGGITQDCKLVPSGRDKEQYAISLRGVSQMKPVKNTFGFCSRAAPQLMRHRNVYFAGGPGFRDYNCRANPAFVNV